MRTSSAISNASRSEVCSCTLSRSLSLGTTTSESTYFLRNLIPRSACSPLFFPSNLKGFVTTPTVRMPISLAIFAIIGAAPVPVPPPIPHVTKIISDPAMNFSRSSRFSSADFWPTSGFPPAPRPFVSFSPICILVSALLLARACLSVFTAMKVTPFMPPSIILLTALQPPPPTPITFISCSVESFISNCNIQRYLL